MPKAIPPIPSLSVPGRLSKLPEGMPFSVYQRGTDVYERLRINGEVEIALEDGSTRKGIVQSLQVGPLIDLVTSFGPQNVYTVGRIYSPLTLIQALTDAAPEDVLDVTKLYTAVIVAVTPVIPNPPMMPAA